MSERRKEVQDSLERKLKEEGNIRILRLSQDEVTEWFKQAQEELDKKIDTSFAQTIRDGIRAYPLPSLGACDISKDVPEVTSPSLERVEERLNSILDTIKTHGARLIGVIPITVTLPSEQGSGENRTAVQNFLIIEK